MSLPSPIAVSGASGLVGSALCRSLEGQGVEIRRLVRRRPAADSSDIYWKPSDGQIDRDQLAGVQGVVHLAGEPIASGRVEARRRDQRSATGCATAGFSGRPSWRAAP